MQNIKQPAEAKKESLHIAARIVCLFLAIVIWFAVAGLKGENYSKEFKVPLQITGSTDDYTVDPETMVVKVRVMGDYSKVQKVRDANLTATLDVKTVKGVGKVSAPVTVLLSTDAPEGVSVVGEYTVNVTVKKTK